MESTAFRLLVGFGTAGLLAAAIASSSIPAAAAAAGTYSDLSSVVCPTTSLCEAVGAEGGTEGNNPSGWQWTSQGGWNAQSMPAVPGTNVSISSDGLSCANVSSCLVVGTAYIQSTGDAAAFAEHWNGTTWQLLTPPPYTCPNSANGCAFVISVSCTSANWCMVVGGTRGYPLADLWNGHSWKTLAIPKSGIFNAIACPSSKDCEAIGSSNSQFLAGEWNGTVWTKPSMVSPNGNQLYVKALSCYASNNCMGVGYDGDGVGDLFTFAEHWNGTTWTLQHSKNPGGSQAGDGASSSFDGVSCPIAGQCLAVGEYTVPHTGDVKNLSEDETGSTWTVVPTPKPAGGVDPYLAQVSCPSASDCVAVGSYLLYPSSGGNPSVVPMSARWNGQSWQLITV